MVKSFHMKNAVSAIDVPEPMGIKKLKEGSEQESTPRQDDKNIESQEDRGREIALEAMRDDKRIWMRRSSGALEQVYIIGIDEKDAMCCWVQPDGSTAHKPRSFLDIVQDQAAAKTERRKGESEEADAYALVENFNRARRERVRIFGRDRLEPVYVFDVEKERFCEIYDEISLSKGWTGAFVEKKCKNFESPFVWVQVCLADSREHNRVRHVTPTQFMRDQVAYFQHEKRRRWLREEDRIEEYVQKTRQLQDRNKDAQQQQRLEFEDILQRESGYQGSAKVGDAFLSVAYNDITRSYELFMDDEGENKPIPELQDRIVFINKDWELSKKDAESTFLFAKSQLEAGEDLVSVFKKVETFVKDLKKDS